ncbi:DUF883 family protein [Variovorax terrae]|uniref:DUF883 domain-containing protein n=1 Tax=Variovorax terrae TaxID=2923278 RepID=A0A9X1VUQ3_9BURK|nr:DUF883 domain-containing protein [Variovorax terrae]MCJ0763618.1 DUF883 domain-containing protein [Variovorax terrae]
MVARTRAKAQGELEDLVADLRDLLSNNDILAAHPEVKALRERLEHGLQSAREAAASAREAALDAAHDAAEQARRTAKAADAYAHDEPWRVAGMALALGAVLGFLIGRR